MRDDDLTKALQLGSAAVADTARPKSAEAIRARGDQRRRRKAAGSALVALAILAGGGAAYAGLGVGQAPPPVTHLVTPSPRPAPTVPTPSSTPRSHSTTAGAGPLPAGQVGSRAAVPWSIVGPGWSLAETATGKPDQDAQWVGGGQMTVGLVDPSGGRYVLYQQAEAQVPWTLLAWSGDGARALFGVNTAGELPYGEYREITLATGAISSFTAPANVTPIGFTRPDGTSILAVRRDGGTLRLQRYSLAGVLQATLASQVIGSQPGSDCGLYCGVVSSPDGTSVAWTYGASLQLVSNGGGLIRSLPVPGAGQKADCTPTRWWDSQTILADCAASTGHRLWLVPADGANPQPLTPVTSSASDYGLFTDAWQAAGVVYASQTRRADCPQSPAGPGGSAILRLRPGGSPTVIPVSGSQGDANTVQGATGPRLLVIARTSCPGTNSLLWLNPATLVTQPLLTSPSGQAGVVAVMAFGG